MQDTGLGTVKKISKTRKFKKYWTFFRT